MGFFDKFFSRGEDKKNYDKYGDVLKNRNTTKDQRQEAIQTLEKIDPQKSIPQLFKRFDMVIDSGLLDHREKDQCMKIIIKHPEIAKEHTLNALRTQKRLAWVIQIAENIFSQDDYILCLLDNLNSHMDVFDEDVRERNIDILLALKDILDPRIVEKTSAFLNLRDDALRIAALECLENQALKSTLAKDLILSCLNTPQTDDNSRFLGMIQDVVRKNGWA